MKVIVIKFNDGEIVDVVKVPKGKDPELVFAAWLFDNEDADGMDYEFEAYTLNDVTGGALVAAERNQ